jgi:hypothetical protein
MSIVITDEVLQIIQMSDKELIQEIALTGDKVAKQLVS